MISKKENVTLEGRVRELQTTFNYLNKEIQSMTKEKNILLDEISSIYAGKMFLDDEYKSLKTKLDTRTLVSEEEKERLEGRVRELQTTFNSLNKEIESMTEKKNRPLDEISSFYARKMFLDEEYKSLQTELDTRTLVSEEEKVRLEGRVREFQTTFNSLDKELESLVFFLCSSKRP